MLTKKSISFFLAFLGVLSISASAKAQFDSNSTALHKQVKRVIDKELSRQDFQKAQVLAQANKRPTNCDNNNDTVFYFNTTNQKSVRVFRPKNNPSQPILMNIFDSKNGQDLASSVPATRTPQKNQITYSAQVKNNIYYATVAINDKSQIQGVLQATDQNGQRKLWTEPAAGEVTLKLNVSQ
ncbi:hypothetical protein BZZ01_01230 [Nostocales cyanobacterium HT-58-2]|nr:hypothetical protein BZZ01_01230 [Nostocales cyanobacterium HT-58-2]